MLRPADLLYTQRMGIPSLVSRMGFALLLLPLLLLTACRYPTQKPSAAAVPLASPVPVPKLREVGTVHRTIEPATNLTGPLVGKVRVIGAHGSFVLIETSSALVTSAVPVGCLLRCRSPGPGFRISTADLRVSPERRSPFLIADVVSGQPSVGDVAYVTVETAPTPAPATSVIPYSSVLIPPPNPTPEPR